MTPASTYIDSKMSADFNNFDAFGNPVNFKNESFPFTPDLVLYLDGK